MRTIYPNDLRCLPSEGLKETKRLINDHFAFTPQIRLENL